MTSSSVLRRWISRGTATVVVFYFLGTESQALKSLQFSLLSNAYLSFPFLFPLSVASSFPSFGPSIPPSTLSILVHGSCAVLAAPCLLRRASCAVLAAPQMSSLRGSVRRIGCPHGDHFAPQRHAALIGSQPNELQRRDAAHAVPRPTLLVWISVG